MHYTTNANAWFSAILDDQHPCIRVGGTDDPAISYFEYGVLGEDSYCLVVYDTNYSITDYYNGGKRVQVKEPIKAQNSAMLYLDSGRLPQSGFSIITPLWVAYCSANFFNKTGSHKLQIPPLFSISDQFGRHRGLCLTSCNFSPAEPFLPDTIVQVVKGADFRPPFNGSGTNAIFCNLTWTNSQNHKITQHFRAVEYFPHAKGKESASWERIYDGVATSIAVYTNAPRTLVIPKVTRIVERRRAYTDSDLGHAYTTTDGSLLSKSNLSLRPSTRILKTAMAPELRAPPFGRFVIYVTLVLLVVPFAYYIKRGAKH